ncbi:MAG: SnoaL-like polyketide cyclase [Solirubrobacterales bacterium]|jgi:ketosteroid isomerase-like protein|nr:SnoaL-like polyketide cyclase [Solirubrobacterales bacterium]
MSEENIKIVRRVYELFNQRDDAAFEELIAPDAKFRFVEWGPFPKRTYEGREAAIAGEYWQDIFSAFPDFHMEPEAIVSGGDYVVATIHNTGRGSGSGVEVEARTGVLVEIRDAKLARLEVFETRAEALEAAGLSH